MAKIRITGRAKASIEAEPRVSEPAAQEEEAPEDSHEPVQALPPGMDALSAHLDRGWDLLQKNDCEAALVSAEHALKVDESSPEAYTLLGAICAAQGKVEDALSHYEYAMQLDAGFIDPMLYAAETYIWPLLEYEQAIELCDKALDVAEDDDEYVDALLLKAEAEAAMEDDAAALHTLKELREIEFSEPIYYLRAARTLLDIGQVGEAERHYLKALRREPELGDAIHGLGLCAEERGDLESMKKHFLRVRELDLQEPAPPWAISLERFDELCTGTLQDLPERIRELLRNVPVIATDYPTEEMVKSGADPRMLGFFAGVPYPEKQNMGGVPQLDTIFLFQRNIERVSRTIEELEEEIEKTLVHEAGHFFGLSEEDLEEMGLG